MGQKRAAADSVQNAKAKAAPTQMAKAALNSKRQATKALIPKAKRKQKAEAAKAESAPAKPHRAAAIDEELHQAQAACRDVYRTTAVRKGQLIRFQALSLGQERSYLGFFAALSDVPELERRKMLSMAKKPGKAGSHILLAEKAHEALLESPKPAKPKESGPSMPEKKALSPNSKHKQDSSPSSMARRPKSICKPPHLQVPPARQQNAVADTLLAASGEESAGDQDPSDHIEHWKFCKKVMDGLGLPGDLQDMIARAKSAHPAYAAFPWFTFVQAGLKFGTWRSALEAAVSEKFPTLKDGCKKRFASNSA
jgi:hypothetical protein